MKKMYVIVSFRDCSGKCRKVTDLRNGLSTFMRDVYGQGFTISGCKVLNHRFSYEYELISNTLKSVRTNLPTFRKAYGNGNVFVFQVFDLVFGQCLKLIEL